MWQIMGHIVQNQGVIILIWNYNALFMSDVPQILRDVPNLRTKEIYVLYCLRKGKLNRIFLLQVTEMFIDAQRAFVIWQVDR